MHLELYHFKSVTSTQDVIKQILANKVIKPACSDKPQVLAVLADHQTAGRGRLPGRIWQSPSGGNFYGTLALKCIWSAEQIKHLPFLVLCVLIEALKERLSSQAAKLLSTKWPNDLLLEGKKFGGILTELWDDKKSGNWLLVGIGLSIVSSPQEAAKLNDYTAGATDARALLRLIVSELLAELDRYGRDGFNPIKRKWLDFGWKLGDTISVNDGEYTGRFIDIGDDGSMVLCDCDGRKTQISYGSID
ncbi:MAG: biotin--[acetyl-CoA-carboxylase] ligase [Holosporales bacterium]|jgi:BirA family biotin operon repressor/biotin-[acetyl-CoA-carboxylase] ligase|nr:biotin--[acetyl-CoA-carboxylase] ligase [Holosporales bacterium]